MDECSSPLERPSHYRKENIPPKKKDAAPMNRFHLLNLDGTDDDSQDEVDDLVTSGAALPTHFPHSVVV